MKATSFMSENTAAYALVPDIVAHLGKHFPHVIPVYFWSTREGARVGLESMGNQTVRVVGAYARRPKVIHPGDDRILVKINDLLFSAAQKGAEFGIAVFAGVPLVNSLADFSLGVRCSWFHIPGTSHAVTDCEFLLPVSEQSPMPTLQHGISGALTPAGIVEIAESQCRELHWMEAAEGMRSVKSPEGMHAGPFGGGYRPFFLVIPSNHGHAPTRAWSATLG
jgi:hypothetical protein